MSDTKKRIGIVSYNIYGNFTNYGSALQTYALHHVIDGLDPDSLESIVVDYCPDILADKDILNPMDKMWDTDPIARDSCRLSLPAIRLNYKKFQDFYKSRYRLSENRYTSKNFNTSLNAESIDGYVCGSDTVFCIDEFGFDDGYYANYDAMRHRSVAYAASFGDSHFDSDSYATLNERLGNFNAIALRESQMIPYLKANTKIPVEKVIDPTLLLEAKDYDSIAAPEQYSEPYLLLYARRYNRAMEDYARRVAGEQGLKIVEISLRAGNKDMGHEMRYDAGVEEFLSLVKHARTVVTNSFHGMIFAVQYRRPFVIFSREQCDTKISELLDLFGITDRLLVSGDEKTPAPIDYDAVHARISEARDGSIDFLKKELTEYIRI